MDQGARRVVHPPCVDANAVAPACTQGTDPQGSTRAAPGRRLAWFVPLSVAVGVVSGVVGASGLLANPFYLNYGVVKEDMIATRAANSTIIQVTKLGAYGAFGALSAGVVLDGLAAGAGAVLAIWISTRWLARLGDRRFRQLAILLMVTAGAALLWQQGSLFLRPD